MNLQPILPSSVTDSNQRCASKTVIQAMTSRHICPCCCSTLLRHTRAGGIYWRCSSCYQEMPV